MTKANGSSIPKVGLGTWSLTGEAGEEAVLAALEIGYRHIDTAQSYDTEGPVGRAVERSGIPRDELFITTKIATTNLRDVEPSLRRSLDALRLDRVDLTLIHWPSAEGLAVASYLGPLARAQDEGLTRLIGVSNFTRALIDEAVAAVGPGRLATNQVECHAYLQNKLLARHCAEAGIVITAYKPLANGRLAADPTLAAIAAAHGVNASQVALAFLLQRGHVVIPKSSQPERMRSNLEAAAVALSDAEMLAIDGLDRGERIIAPAWGPEWD